MLCVMNLHGVEPKIRMKIDITFYLHGSSTWQSKSGASLAGLEVEQTHLKLLEW